MSLRCHHCHHRSLFPIPLMMRMEMNEAVAVNGEYYREILTNFYDLSRKLPSQVHKENTAPPPNNAMQQLIQTANTRSILNTHKRSSLNGRESLGSLNKPKRLSMSDATGELYELYRTNGIAKAPKSNEEQTINNLCNKFSQISPTSAETNEPYTVAAIALNSAASQSSPKNLKGIEMPMLTPPIANSSSNINLAFHPRIKYTSKSLINNDGPNQKASATHVPAMTAIPTSVVVASALANSGSNNSLDIKPEIHPSTGLIITPVPSGASSTVIKPVPSASEAVAALQKLQEAAAYRAVSTGILRNFYPTPLMTQRENLKSMPNTHADEKVSNHGDEDDDDDDDDDYDGEGADRVHPTNAFADIHLIEKNSSVDMDTTDAENLTADDSQQAINLSAVQAQMQALHHFGISLNLANNLNDASANSSDVAMDLGPDGEQMYKCKYCGKKYRWKSTLRRHMSVECGNKEPSHQCPYCPYKAKQRGNLGVHVRKHHANLPQLASKRRSKYSTKLEDNPSGSAGASDDSSSRLIIDCSK
uniref:C2H2-type domain-containing protein n=1 Tax=Glossina pallidipes TaxID=7398 RepID=A0A1B0AHR4_GLOPL